MKQKLKALAARSMAALGLGVVTASSYAATDANVSTAISVAQAKFDDNIGAVSGLFVGITVILTVIVMAVKWFRRAAK